MANVPAQVLPTALAIAVALTALLALRIARGRTYGVSFGRAAFSGVSAEAPVRIAGKSRPSHWIDPAERLRVEGAVDSGLAGCSAELVVAVADRCADYPEAGWRLGLLLAAAVPVVSTAASGSTAGQLASTLGAVELVAVQAAALSLGHLLCRIAALRRMWTSDRRRRDAARDRAWQAYAESGLRRTPDDAGALLFVALFERRVVLLLGAGLAESLGPGESAAELAAPIAAAVEADLAHGAEAASTLAARLCPHPPRRDQQRPTPVVLLES